MEQINTIKEKFNIYETLADDICILEDKLAGKFIKLIYRYIFYDENLKNELKDMAEIKFYANKSAIEKMKKEQHTKNNIPHIIFYIFYAKLFDQLNDIDAGRLIKKIADKELGKSFLKGKLIDINADENYYTLRQMYKQYRSEKVNRGLSARHDFSKIREEFSNLDWRSFNEQKYKNVDCVKLYQFMRENHLEEDRLRIEEVIDAYFNNM